MILGITFEEKILEEISLENYFNILKSSDIKLLELAPNFIDYDTVFYEKIYRQIEKNNFKFNFHLPSFVDEHLDVQQFNQANEKYICKYFEKLDEIFDLKNNDATVVFHGCKYEKIKQLEAFKKTVSFIEFILSLISKKGYNLTLSIETLNKNKYKIIGDSRKDLMNLLQSINSPKLRICWDITHDFLNYNKILYPNGLMLDVLNHCHVHGFDKEKTHISLSKNIQLLPGIKFAKKNNIPIIIELLMQDNYLDILSKDISTIRSII